MSTTTITPNKLKAQKLSTKQKFERTYNFPKNADGSLKVSWITTVAFVLFHAGTVAALYFFSWKLLAAAFLVHFVCIGFGIGLGYHRLHTHRSYKVPKVLEYFFAICGCMTLEGGPISWVATHRKHHQFSDEEGDPHSPREGGWWAHILWMSLGDPFHNKIELGKKYAPDLVRDPFYVWLNEYHWLPVTVFGLSVWAIFGYQALLWTVFLRVTYGLHVTWLVNSASHMWGGRRFNTRDDSRNNWWVALLTFGEGWHNNHHAHPVSARHGLAWYELDITWMQIWLMKKLGIAKNVKVANLDGDFEVEAKAA